MGKAEDYLCEQEWQTEEREQLHTAQLVELLNAVIPPLLRVLEDKEWPGARLVQFGMRRRNLVRFWKKEREVAGDKLVCWSVGFGQHDCFLFLTSTGQLGVRRLLPYAWRWEQHMYTYANLLGIVQGLRDLEKRDDVGTNFLKQAVIERQIELEDDLYKTLASWFNIDTRKQVVS